MLPDSVRRLVRPGHRSRRRRRPRRPAATRPTSGARRSSYVSARCAGRPGRRPRALFRRHGSGTAARHVSRTSWGRHRSTRAPRSADTYAATARRTMEASCVGTCRSSKACWRRSAATSSDTPPPKGFSTCWCASTASNTARVLLSRSVMRAAPWISLSRRAGGRSRWSPYSSWRSLARHCSTRSHVIRPQRHTSRDPAGLQLPAGGSQLGACPARTLSISVMPVSGAATRGVTDSVSAIRRRTANRTARAWLKRSN